MEFQSKKTSEINLREIDQILKLKDSHWKFGYDLQLKWFRKNAQPNDVHNLMLVKKKIEGYTFLPERSLNIYLDNKHNENSGYILFTTFIISKKFRNFPYYSKMMRFNSETIIKKKKISFLLCEDMMKNFYKRFGWILLNKSKFEVADHKINSKNAFVYNANKLTKINNIKFYFFYNK